MHWEYNVMGTDLYHLVQWFLAYSILGWLVESIYMSLCARKWVNRGFAFGPMCPIYGVGALGVYFLLRPFAGNYPLLYVAGAMLATGFEFLVGRLMDVFLGQVWWDYSEKPLNYKGVVCAESTLAWGVYTVCLFGFLHKVVMKISGMYSVGAGRTVAILLLSYYCLDFCYQLCKAKFPGVHQRTQEKAKNIKERVIHFAIK